MGSYSKQIPHADTVILHIVRGIFALFQDNVLPARCKVVSEGRETINGPTKFPWIRKFASIGDSYSAGLGAGNRIDWSCSRYDRSYPHLLHQRYLGDSAERAHQFLSCSGATTLMIVDKQVTYLEKDLDLLTISSGGNDIGLTPILNNCIYQFFMASAEECRAAIKEAERSIANKASLYKNITELIDIARPRMNQAHGVIYVTGTRYSGFFGTDDDLCNNVTWSVWKNIKPQDAKFLTLDLRKSLDKMVRSVNEVLLAAAEASGPNVRFIDYNDAIKDNRGRYCESGVFEPDPNRKELDFYEWNTADLHESHAELNRTGDDVPRGSFEGDIAELINKTLQEHPEWEFDPDKGFVNKSKVHENGIIEDTIHWLLPDCWKRVFHLRPGGHAVIAQMLVEDLEANGPGTSWDDQDEL
ncbi:SGNH hydrolase-type esterase domain-containing protein [Lophiotrema nucula]|uniref:SGNH hydrolase-type esterase domain-containing protein n=1 Tax=Lophiotrema nucula TaxID=690887 RepID=A0A6A5Z5Z5_9PLEO|nr:SGNH hydrolase-type esterase domain-containing protein [Lophiotrema nucula]